MGMRKQEAMHREAASEWAKGLLRAARVAEQCAECGEWASTGGHGALARALRRARAEPFDGLSAAEAADLVRREDRDCAYECRCDREDG